MQIERTGGSIQELSTLLKNLRPKFSIRKKMVGRRMILLPGILPKFKKLRVVARWLVRALYLKRERSLTREWLRLLQETVQNEGPSVKFKEQFEITVSHNLNNLRTGRRRRFFRRN
jgi:ribosomal protein S7